MGNVLVFLEQADRRLRPAALSAISLARAIHKSNGGKLLFVLIGESVADAAKEASQFGADAIITVEAPALKNYLAETYAPILARLASEQGASVIAGCATSIGKDLLPRVAGIIDAGIAPDVSSVVSAKQYRRATNAGNAIQTLEVLSDVVVVSGRQTDFPRAQPSGGSSPISAAAPGTATNFIMQGFVQLFGLSSDYDYKRTARASVFHYGEASQVPYNFAIIENMRHIYPNGENFSFRAVDVFWPFMKQYHR